METSGGVQLTSVKTSEIITLCDVPMRILLNRI